MTPFLPYFDDEFYRLTKIKNMGQLGGVQRGAGKEVLQTKPGENMAASWIEILVIVMINCDFTISDI